MCIWSHGVSFCWCRVCSVPFLPFSVWPSVGWLGSGSTDAQDGSLCLLPGFSLCDWCCCCLAFDHPVWSIFASVTLVNRDLWSVTSICCFMVYIYGASCTGPNPVNRKKEDLAPFCTCK